MQVERDIVCAPEYGERGRLDLYRPLRFFEHIEQAIADFLHETLETDSL